MPKASPYPCGGDCSCSSNNSVKPVVTNLPNTLITKTDIEGAIKQLLDRVQALEATLGGNSIHSEGR